MKGFLKFSGTPRNYAFTLYWNLFPFYITIAIGKTYTVMQQNKTEEVIWLKGEALNRGFPFLLYVQREKVSW